MLDDAGALSECMHAAYAGYTARLDGQSLPPLTVDYRDEIRHFPVWIAESEGNLVGGLIVMHGEGLLTFANIAVCPVFQGKGLGRGLLEFADAEAERQGYSELRLATHVSLVENVSLYAHLGWAEIARDDSRVYMSKRVG